MLGGSLYCVIIGGLCVLCTLFALGTVATLFVMDRWSKRRDPGAPGFLEMDRRDDGHHRGTEDTETHRGR